MKRFWLVGAALPMALVIGACADDPAAPADTPEIDLHVIKAKCDFFTGGGSVVAGGGRVTFGVHAGRSRRGTVFGHFTVIDHRTDPPTRYQSTRIDDYGRPAAPFSAVIPEGVTRIVEGQVRVNKRDIRNFTAYLNDNGEPGRRVDRIFFRVAGNEVISGPTSGGLLTLRLLTGGNLQFHDHCIPGNPQSGKQKG
jgi:hypothetical protein